MKKLFLILTVSVVSTLVFAHEFWLAPQRFFYRIRETAKIRFQVGEDFKGENWTGNKEKITQLTHYLPSGGVENLSGALSENNGDSLSLPLQEMGTHMVTFRSTNSFIRLEASKFNAYLAEDGLDEASNYRKEHHELQKDGREYYQRSVKTIIQVGELITEQCNEPTGLPLDIIPVENPYSLPERLKWAGLPKVGFKVLFFGKPLANAVVKVWHQLPGKTAVMEVLRTNRRGGITTARYPGRIMISCVHMERNGVDTAAEWQSYWGNLTFEYSKFFAAQ